MAGDREDPRLLAARRRARDDGRVTGLVAAVGLAALAYFAGWDLLGTLTERACLEAGYTAGRVTATWGRYCTARVDNSDVVLPLSEARRRPRR
jgi:hypothetical protein